MPASSWLIKYMSNHAANIVVNFNSTKQNGEKLNEIDEFVLFCLFNRFVLINELH